MRSKPDSKQPPFHLMFRLDARKALNIAIRSQLFLLMLTICGLQEGARTPAHLKNPPPKLYVSAEYSEEGCPPFWLNWNSDLHSDGVVGWLRYGPNAVLW